MVRGPREVELCAKQRKASRSVSARELLRFPRRKRPQTHPWIEACPRAALVVAILRRIAYTMLALFRSVTQRSDERRATPWQTLMTALFVALITTSGLDLRDPKPLHLR